MVRRRSHTSRISDKNQSARPSASQLYYSRADKGAYRSYNMGQEHHHDHGHNDELQPEIWTYSVLAASLPLFWMGNYFVAFCFVAIAIMYRVMAPQKISPQDQLSIQYNIWSAQDVIKDLLERRDESTRDDNRRVLYRSALLVALPSLAKKNNKHQQQRQRIELREANSKKIPSTKDEDPIIDSLALLSQQAVYLGLAAYPDDDEVVDSSFALLALVGKNEMVRERLIHEADVYGLDVLANCMGQALYRAKEVSDKRKEQQMAEIQRKGCLMLGALADGDAILASQVVQDGCLKAILDAVSWYRFHEQVANWALWSIFILCYENRANKAALLELNGIPIILQTMKNCSESVEVTRHGIATVFDLLRDDYEEATQGPSLNRRKIRETAITDGLHAIIIQAIESFSDNPSNMDIAMMGRELLVGTGYSGQIPEPVTS